MTEPIAREPVIQTRCTRRNAGGRSVPSVIKAIAIVATTTAGAAGLETASKLTIKDKVTSF